MNKTTSKLSDLIALILLLPALVFAAEGMITPQQQQVGENFMKALMKNDYKAAYQLFSPAVRSKFPFKIFSDIQTNVQKKIGMPVSYSVKKEGPPAVQDSPPARLYNMVYAKGEHRTAIPLELTFDPGDPQGGLASFSYHKNQMKQAAQ